MSKYESNGWYADETIALIAIIKELDLQHKAEITELDWHHVAHRLADKAQYRSVQELCSRFTYLKDIYFEAYCRSNSCEYYNYLHDLLHARLEQPVDAQLLGGVEPNNVTNLEVNPFEASENEMEQKYAHLMQAERHIDNGRKVSATAVNALKSEIRGHQLEIIEHGLQQQQAAAGTPKISTRAKWAEGEVEIFLNLIITLKLLTPLLRKRNAKVFKLIAKEMAKRSYAKTPEQLRIKYHQLRRQYAVAKNGGDSFEHFDTMHQLFSAAEAGADLSSDEHNDSEDEDADLANCSEGTLDSQRTPYTKTPKAKWATGEVEALINIITTQKLQGPLMRKRNAKYFKRISKEMAKLSFDKVPSQLRFKYHQLRRQYAIAKGGGDTFDHFEAMDQLLNSAEAYVSSGASESDSSVDEEGRNVTDDNYWWTDAEVDTFLSIIKEQNLLPALDGSKIRNFQTLLLISDRLAQLGFRRTGPQLRNKLRYLRKRYKEAKVKGLAAVRMLPRHFEAMDELMQIKRTGKSPAEVTMTRAKHRQLSPAEAQQSGSESESNESDDEDGDKAAHTGDSYYWTDAEVDALLGIIKKHNLFPALDGSRKRNFKTLVQISTKLNSLGFHRTGHQLRNKLRLLLKRYWEAKRGVASTVQLLPRHQKALDELMQRKRGAGETEELASPAKKAKRTPLAQLLDSESELSNSSCDLLRAAAEDESFEDEFEMPVELTPMEVLNTISEGQKELLTFLKTSNENFLRQQHEMQRQFLRDMSTMMRQEREETFRMLRELMQSK